MPPCMRITTATGPRPHARIALLISPHAADLPRVLTTSAGTRPRDAHHHPERGHGHVVRGECAHVSIGAGKGAGNVAELTGLGIGTGVGAAERHKRHADSSAILGDG